MPQHDFKNALSGSSDIVAPASGYNALFWDNSGTPKYRDANGIDHSMGGLSTWYDVTAYGLKGDDSTDNLAALNTLLALAPLESTIFFPAGTFRFSGEIAINFDRRLRFLGCGRGRSLLKTTSATANLFNISVAGYYGSFEELGFTSSVTRTAGSYILASNANAYLNVTGCELLSYFIGIQLTGSIAGNLGLIDDCQLDTPAANGQGIVINGSSINIVISNTTINHGTGGAATGQCIEINQCGAVQISASDIIGGINALRINATSTVSAVKVTNTFFDQSNGSTVKILGTGAASRISFISGGITSGSASTHAVEVVGTGAILPGGIDLIGVDLYNTFGSPTNSAIVVNGCQDINVSSCRISGFSTGILSSASASAVTKLNIQGNTIGPTENFLGNVTGINIQSGTYGGYIVADNNLTGNTTNPLVDSGAVTAPNQKIIGPNLGCIITGSDNNIVATGAITTEAVVCKMALPLGSLRVGTTFRVTAFGNSASTADTVTFRIKIGTAGTTADTLITSVAPLTTLATDGLVFQGMVTVRTIGSGGTCLGNGWSNLVGATATTGTITISNTSATTAVNTTVANFIDLTIQSSTGTVSIYNACIEVIQP